MEIADDPSRYDTTEAYSVCARLEEYPSTVTVEAEGTISLLAACVTPNSLVASTPVNPSANDFDGATVSATLAEFTVDPAFCGVSYSCTGVARQDGAATTVDCSSFSLDLDFGGGGDGSISISADSTVYLAQTSITPGVYEVSISGSVVGAAPAVEQTIVFEFTFDDPCDAPAAVTPPTLADFEYLIGATTGNVYTVADFAVTPAFCTVEYSYVFTPTTIQDVAGATVAPYT